jgi:hypothetical protein
MLLFLKPRDQYLSGLMLIAIFNLIIGCSAIDHIFKPTQKTATTKTSDTSNTELLTTGQPGLRNSLKSSGTEPLLKRSPIFCSSSGEYPDQLPTIALSFYEASVRDVLA